MSKPDRRNFLTAIPALAAGIVGVRHIQAALELQEFAAPLPDRWPLEAKAAVVPPEYPRPLYLPPGFVRTSTWRDHPGGFMTAGEVVQFFHPGEYVRNDQSTSLMNNISPLTKNRPPFDTIPNA